jgi:hypothetical protein
MSIYIIYTPILKYVSIIPSTLKSIAPSTPSEDLDFGRIQIYIKNLVNRISNVFNLTLKSRMQHFKRIKFPILVGHIIECLIISIVIHTYLCTYILQRNHQCHHNSHYLI